MWSLSPLKLAPSASLPKSESDFKVRYSELPLLQKHPWHSRLARDRAITVKSLTNMLQ